MRKQADKHEQLIMHFWLCQKREYFNSLRKFNKITRHNKQVISKGDVIIYDDKLRLQWKLTVVEGLIKGNDC